MKMGLWLIVALIMRCSYAMDAGNETEAIRARKSLEAELRGGTISLAGRACLAAIYADGTAGCLVDRQKARQLLEAVLCHSDGTYNNRPDVSIGAKSLLAALCFGQQPPSLPLARVISLYLLDELQRGGARASDPDTVLVQKHLTLIPIEVEPLYRYYQIAALHYRVGNVKDAATTLERDIFSSTKQREAALSIGTVLRAKYLKASIKLSDVDYFGCHEVEDLFNDVIGGAFFIESDLAQRAIDAIQTLGGVIPKTRLPLYDPTPRPAPVLRRQADQHPS